MPETASVEAVVIPQAKDIGGFGVRRALPSAQRRMVGPFVFLDEMGPADFAPGAGMDVRPHPHIGLATLTYLLDGALFHRDSLGSAQEISPGAVNLMVAGRGIVHSERSPADFRAAGGRMRGLQLWIGLPQKFEETEPGFEHHPREALPMLEGDGFRLRLAVGTLHGLRAPVKTFSTCFFADIALDQGAVYEFCAGHDERAFYLVSGEIEIEGADFAAGQLVVIRPGARAALRAKAASRLAALGGDALDGPRFLWWNFVSSNRERIRAARAEWEAGHFKPIAGDPEFIPAPELKAL
ncbi:pirin family protein [Rhodoblastus acidophilus]|uniref:Pirin family protein n=1 Tax=Candidatus Rhodoblastus alkanivorans TaxID=2954117 RepID=A0ABS9ZB74_9HYPH|nr:pirin family protein [Candidatus Rhodoblastus alkanivorans]MCI4677835.1 pirin family protein [Candidatus Rhodoblastus alkanivorans]MCI4684666.1 pirin family protein [Candidatus Rhodoblastus alkanivorans]MDI4641988.1 pirin family protein [Rhodoblastus acidophilus]